MKIVLFSISIFIFEIVSSENSVELYAPCKVNSHCQPLNNQSCVQLDTTKSRRCYCKDGYYKVDSFHCLKSVQRNAPCKGLGVCGNLKCTRHKKCHCKNGQNRDTKDSCTNYELGSRCDRTYSCKDPTHLCENEICVCKTNFKAIKNKCINDFQHYACEDDSACSPWLNAVCGARTGKCSCREGFLLKSKQMGCKPRELNTHYCLEDSECKHIKYSSCKLFHMKICACDVGRGLVLNNSCHHFKLGSDCSHAYHNNSCVHTNSSMECQDKICQCSQAHRPLQNQNGCEISLGSPCKHNRDCTTDTAICSMGICICIPAHSIINGVCVKQFIGSRCKDNDQCSFSITYSVCRQKRCTCSNGFKGKIGEDKCKALEVNDPCTTHPDCSTIGGALCLYNKCACSQGFKYVKKLSICQKLKLSDQCTSNLQCNAAISLSVCNNGLCHCNPPRSANILNTECSLYILGSECQSDRNQCHQDFQICSNQKCSCLENTLQVGKICRKRIAGDICTTNKQCSFYLAHSWCKQKTCSCDDGYVFDKINNQCSFRVLNDICRISFDCSYNINNTFCSSGRCICRESYLEMDGKCEPIKLLDRCSSDGDCGHVAEATCDGVCKCSTGFKQKNNICVHENSCSRDSECGQLSCIDNTCKCPVDHIIKDIVESVSGRTINKCIVRLVGMSCVINDNCQHLNAICSKNMVCKCKGDLKARSDKKKCIVFKLNQRCFGEQDCSPLNSKCENSKCTCKRYYRAYRGQCLTRTLDTQCSHNYQCQEFTEGSVCSKVTVMSSRGVCKCRSDLHQRNGSCISRKLGDICKVNSYCGEFIANSICHQDRCLCKKGFIVTDYHTVCRKRKVNDDCDRKNDCSENKNTNCFRGSCICSQGYVLVDETCDPVKLSGKCESHMQCRHTIKHSTCSSSYQCICVDGFKQDNKKCVNMNLGDVCQEDSQCVALMAKCERGKCTCTMGYIKKHDRCELVKIGDTCWSNSECDISIVNSICGEKRTCKCKIPYSSDRRGDNCIKRVINDTCSVNRECLSVAHSTCSSNRCACSRGYVANPGLDGCRPVRVGDTCQVNGDCQAVLNSECTQGSICSCKSGYQSGFDGSTCAIITLNQRCRDDKDCLDTIGDTKCVNNFCRCKLGFSIADNGKCIRMKLTSACQMTSQCYQAVKNSICRDLLCTCAKGYSSKDGKCYKMTEGSVCTSDATCVPLERSSCIKGSCTCEPGTVFKEGICTNRVIGDPCSEDDDCSSSMRYSTCRRGSCKCKHPYSASAGQFCILRYLEEKCDTENDCSTLNSECQMKQCRCRAHYIVDLNICRNRKIHDICQHDDNCTSFVSHSTCLNNTCQCEYLFVDKYNQCIPRTLGDSCHTNEQCLHLKDSQCTDSECKCKVGYRFVDDSCVKIRIGSPCSWEGDCESSVSKSYCSMGKCTCDMAHFSSDNGTSCKPIFINETCRDNGDCALLGKSECSTKGHKCVCSVGSLYQRNKCVALTLGSRCNNNDDCSRAIQYGTCDSISHTCTCKHPTTIMFGNCILSWLSSDCEYDLDCTAKHHVCRDKRCSCKPNYIPKSDLFGCRQIAIGDGCTTDEQCVSISNSICINQVCACNQTFYSDINTNFICRKRTINRPCNDSQECQVTTSDSNCENHICKCKENYAYVDSKCISVKLNGACLRSVQCSSVINNTVCVNERCSCAKGFRMDSTRKHCTEVQLDQECISQADCANNILYSTCSKGLCKCLTGFRKTQSGVCTTVLETPTPSALANSDENAISRIFSYAGFIISICVLLIIVFLFKKISKLEAYTPEISLISPKRRNRRRY